MLLESVHKRLLIIYIKFDQRFEIVSGSNIYSAFIVEGKLLHFFFWNRFYFLDRDLVVVDISELVTGSSIWRFSALQGAMSCVSTVHAEVIVPSMFTFFGGKSSTTMASASALSSSAVRWSATQGGSINLRIVFGDFLNSGIVSRATGSLVWAHKGTPVLVEFLRFLN